MTNRIEVELLGVLQKAANKKTMRLEFDGVVAVKDVILKLTSLFSPEFKQALIDPELNDPRPNVLVLLNGKEINVLNGLDTRVKNGDELVLIPVSHGG